MYVLKNIHVGVKHTRRGEAIRTVTPLHSHSSNKSALAPSMSMTNPYITLCKYDVESGCNITHNYVIHFRKVSQINMIMVHTKIGSYVKILANNFFLITTKITMQEQR